MQPVPLIVPGLIHHAAEELQRGGYGRVQIQRQSTLGAHAHPGEIPGDLDEINRQAHRMPLRETLFTPQQARHHVHQELQLRIQSLQLLLQLGLLFLQPTRGIIFNRSHCCQYIKISGNLLFVGQRTQGFPRGPLQRQVISIADQDQDPSPSATVLLGDIDIGAGIAK